MTGWSASASGYYEGHGRRAQQVTRAHLVAPDGAFPGRSVRTVACGAPWWGVQKAPRVDVPLDQPLPAGLTWCPKCLAVAAEKLDVADQLAALVIGAAITVTGPAARSFITRTPSPIPAGAAAVPGIPLVFQPMQSDPTCVSDKVTDGCEWVIAGEGVATRMLNGVKVVLDDNGFWWVRTVYGPDEQPPPQFIRIRPDDDGTVHGYEPVERSRHAAAFDDAFTNDPRYETVPGFPIGTYELVGPDVIGNPEERAAHELIAHVDAQRVLGDGTGRPRPYDVVRGMAEIAAACRWEGIVFRHPDGRTAKIRLRDFPR